MALDSRIKKSLVTIGLLVAGALIIPVGHLCWQSSYSKDVIQAVNSGNTVKLKKLFDWGASPNRVPGTINGDAPLMDATRKSDIRMMKFLINAGADVNQRSTYNATALMVAGTPQSAQLLLNAGADPKLRDDQNFSAWDYSKKRKLNAVSHVLERAAITRIIQ